MEQLSRAFMDRSRRAERREDAVVDLSIIDAERIEGQRITANAAVLNTWGLRPNQPDLDPEACAASSTSDIARPSMTCPTTISSAGPASR
jgi:hypothetical protein